MTSHAWPCSAASSLRNRAMTLSRSLKVGTTTDNCGVTACDEVPCPGLMASFMRQRISPGAGDAKAERVDEGLGRDKTGQKHLKMPTTTNNGRAYIRRCPIIPWSSQLRSYQASTVPLG